MHDNLIKIHLYIYIDWAYSYCFLFISSSCKYLIAYLAAASFALFFVIPQPKNFFFPAILSCTRNLDSSSFSFITLKILKRSMKCNTIKRIWTIHNYKLTQIWSLLEISHVNSELAVLVSSQKIHLWCMK